MSGIFVYEYQDEKGKEVHLAPHIGQAICEEQGGVSFRDEKWK